MSKTKRTKRAKHSEPRVAAPSERPSTTRRRIMLADDDVMLQRLLRRDARRNGDELIQETKGQATVNHAAETNPDVIVLDLAFSDADGRDVLASLKSDQRTAHIPVVVWSGGRADIEADCRVVLSLGAEDYVEKSGTLLLLKKLDRVLLRVASERPRAAVKARRTVHE